MPAAPHSPWKRVSARGEGFVTLLRHERLGNVGGEMLSSSSSLPGQPSLRLRSHTIWRCGKIKTAKHWEQGNAGEGEHAADSRAKYSCDFAGRKMCGTSPRASLGQAERGA